MNDALRAAVWAAWPGLLLASAFVLYRAWRFSMAVREAMGRLVLLMVVAWIAAMVGFAWLLTSVLQGNPVAAPFVVAFLVVWSASLVVMIWVVHGWGAQAVTINRFHSELRRLDAVRQQLITTVSHELNTPLTPAVLQQEALARGHLGALNEKQELAVGTIGRSLSRIQRIVAQVVLCTQIQSGSLTLRRADLDVVTLFDGYEVEIEVEGVRKLHGDRQMLRRALDSLVRNADKFSDGKPVSVAISSDARETRIAVHDEGLGFRPEDTDHMFQPFRQTDEARARTDAGAGLDLYIAHAIVAAHGGTVTAASDGPGAGATFTVHLPKLAAGASGL